MSTDWNTATRGYTNYLRIERSLSPNSVDAYLNDLARLRKFITGNRNGKAPEEVSYSDLSDFISECASGGDSARTQARLISGIRSFFGYLVTEGIASSDPSSLLESPRLGVRLPYVLTTEEIDSMISRIDLSKPEGHRNKAIIETMFGCGLRVSETVNLKITDLHLKEGFISVTGKGNKQRLVPLGKTAAGEIRLYMEKRATLPVIKDRNILFLNRRGAGMTRVMVFTIIKNLAAAAGIKKKVSPHTFRHSFATELIHGGADLRAVQEMLGHESITTTEIYTHIDRKYLRKTIETYHPRSKQTNKGVS